MGTGAEGLKIDFRSSPIKSRMYLRLFHMNDPFAFWFGQGRRDERTIHGRWPSRWKSRSFCWYCCFILRSCEVCSTLTGTQFHDRGMDLQASVVYASIFKVKYWTLKNGLQVFDDMVGYTVITMIILDTFLGLQVTDTRNFVALD